MTDDELLSMVLASAKAHEGCRVRTFQVERDGRTLQVQLLDYGSEAGAQRYMVQVTDAPDVDLDATHSLSNPSGTVADALAGVHWNEFGARS